MHWGRPQIARNNAMGTENKIKTGTIKCQFFELFFRVSSRESLMVTAIFFNSKSAFSFEHPPVIIIPAQAFKPPMIHITLLSEIHQ